jgi:hypothetical protein
MRDLAEVADLYRCRTQEMRAIAEGIGDHKVRANLLEFVAEYERLAREVKARDLGVTLPSRAAASAR